jgi:hypothetical protein
MNNEFVKDQNQASESKEYLESEFHSNNTVKYAFDSESKNQDDDTEEAEKASPS